MYNILIMIACYFVANYIYAPVTPAVATDFSVSSDLAKATMTLFQFGALTSCIVAALFADFVGKKNFLVFGLSLAFIGTIVCLASPNIYILMLGRVLQGFGAATGFMMGFALAVDLFKPEQVLRLVAINGVTVAIICVVAPYLGGTMAKFYSWRYTFLFIAPLFLITVVISQMYLPSQANKRIPTLNFGQSLAEIKTIISNPRYLGFASLNGIFIAGFYFASTILPFYYKTHFQLAPDKIGLILGGAQFFSFGVASMLSRWFNRWLHSDYVVRMALGIAFTGALLMLLTAWKMPGSLGLSIASLAVYSFGFGALYAASITESMRVFLQLTTKASAIRTVLLTAGSFLGAFAALNVSDDNLLDLGFALVLTSLLSIVMFSIRNLGRGR